MIKNKWIGAVAALLMAAAVLLISIAYLNPSAFQFPASQSQPAYVSAMDKNEILSMQVIADEKEWAEMLENAAAEEYIAADVIINGTQIKNVGIRPKGNSSLSMVAQDETTDRFSFKIEFDHFITGQTWLGLDKIAVNNMQGDATYMKEYLSYDIMDSAGVETPLYAFADISVNEEPWGFYLAVECLEDSYAERVYGKNHGKLYKPESMGGRGEGRMNEFMADLPNDRENAPPPPGQQPNPDPGQPQAPLLNGENQPNDGENRGGFNGGGPMGGMAANGVSLQYTDDEISSYSGIFDNAVFDTTDQDYQRLIKSLKKLANSEDLKDTVDVEVVLKYFAAHTTVVNLDSYVSGMGHNYYLYEDDGQLTILPWDYNLAFGGFQSGNAAAVVNFPIDTPVSGVSLEDRPLLGKLLEVPQYSKLYHNYLRQIVDGYFNSGRFEQTIDSLNSLITPYVEKDPSAFYDYEAYQKAVTELKKLGLLRAESIEGQLDGLIPSTSQGQSADSSKLVDAASVNLSALGSQGGGPGGMPGGGDDRRPDGMGAKSGVNREIMPQVMEIIQAAGEKDLTEEQVSQLKELGLTDEQINQLKSMAQNRFGEISGQRPNQPPGAPPNGPNVPNQRAGKQTVNTPGLDTNTWISIGGCAALLLMGILFAYLYKRRRS
jgi:spore coat protein CotH